MIRRRAGLAAALLILVALLAWQRSGSPARLPSRAPDRRPALLLLTSLPLVFGETFVIGDGGSPALSRLQERYRVEPIPLADAASLRGHRLLLMAHPRAQTAEALVDLDSWVRGGGDLLLLADPLLEWPSGRPLGDPLRPPPGFADTGLLRHWGLTLDGAARRGELVEPLDGYPVRFISPGAVGAFGTPPAARGRIVRTRVGQGRVTVVADADWLARKENLEPLMIELNRFERHQD